jgi:hypothetical protein
MGTDLLALGIVAIAVGSFLFYKAKVRLAARATETDPAVPAARARALVLLVVGALLTAASIPANLLAADPAQVSPPEPSAAPNDIPAPSAEPSAPSATPSATPAAPLSSPPSAPRASPSPAKAPPGRSAPARKK